MDHLGHGKAALWPIEVPVRGLEVRRDRVVDLDANSGLLETSHLLVALLTSDNKQMPRGVRPRLYPRQNKVGLMEEVEVLCGDSPAPVVPRVEVSELDPEYRRLDLIEPAVESPFLVDVLDLRAIVP